MKKRIIFHIDVNNAFVSWLAIYKLKNGYPIDIRNTYCVVGGDEDKRRGIVLAKSNLARKMGVVTGEPLYQARKKCPNLEVYNSEYCVYEEYSNSLMKYLSSYSPLMEVASIDECYIDYTDCIKLFGSPIDIANKIKEEVKSILGFTVNIGIANNKLCAKMASDFEKPDKIHTLYDEEIITKMYPLPIDNLYGIGRMTAPKLKEMGINTIGDLANYDELKLVRIFKNQAHEMINLARGIDDSLVNPEEWIPKGIGNEITLETDIYDKERLYDSLLYLSEKVGIRLRRQKKYASVVCVTIKDPFFRRRSHQKTLTNATNLTSDIYNLAKEILNEMFDDRGVRLIGVRLDKLVDTLTYQVSLFSDTKVRENEERINYLLDDLKEKYGYKIISTASLMEKKK